MEGGIGRLRQYHPRLHVGTFAKASAVGVVVFGIAVATRAEPPAPKESGDILASIKYRRQMGHTKVITALAYTPDSKTLLAASLDGTVKLFDAEATKVLRTIATSSQEVYAMAISPDGKLLATAGSWSEIQIWDIATAKELQVLKGHAGPVAAVAFSPDGTMVLTGSSDTTARLWAKEGSSIRGQRPAKEL